MSKKRKVFEWLQQLKKLEKLENALAKELGKLCTGDLSLDFPPSKSPSETFDILDGISELSRLAKNIQGNNQRLIENFESTASSLRKTISTSLSQLAHQEKLASSELASLKSFAETSSASSLSDDYSVYGYDELLLKYGKSGGWDPYSHLVFVQMRNKANYVDLVSNKLCFTRETVIQHDAWYCALLSAKMKKDESIFEWRRHRDMTQTDRIQFESAGVSNEEESLQADKSRFQKTDEDELKRREKVKRELEEWKRKQKERADEELMEQRRKDDEQMEKEKQKQMGRMSIKKSVEDYKRKKQMIQLALKKENTIDRTKVNSKELQEKTIHRIQEMQINMKQKKELEEREEKEKLDRLEKMRSPVKHHVDEYLKSLDMQNHFQMDTISVKQYKSSKREDDPSSFFVPGRGMVGSRVLPHRQIPSWRRAM